MLKFRLCVAALLLALAGSSSAQSITYSGFTPTAINGPVLNVKTGYGAVGDGTANDTTAIQNAIDAACTAGGGIVWFPLGTYSVSDLTVSCSNVTLRGVKTGATFTASVGGVILKARSGTTNLLKVAPDVLASVAVSSVIVESLALDGNSFASVGLLVQSTNASVFRDLTVRGVSSAAVKTGVVSDTFAGTNFVYNCTFENITVGVTGTAKGLWASGSFTSATAARTVFSRFIGWHVTYTNGSAYYLDNADDNVFYDIHVSRNVGGTGYGLEFDASAPGVATNIHTNHVFFIWAGPGGIYSHGASALRNTIHAISTEDGPIPVTVDSPSTLYYDYDTGVYALNRILAGSITDDLGTPIQVGGSVRQALAGGSTVQSTLTGEGTVNIQESRLSADASSAQFVFLKGRGTIVSPGTVTTGDDTGSIFFQGYDASGTPAAVNSAAVKGDTEGTIAAGAVPGVLLLQTATAAGSLTTALRLESGQRGIMSGSGAGSQSVGGAQHRLQLFGAAGLLSAMRGSADTTGSAIRLGKSRNTSYGSFTAITTGDEVGRVEFNADDGTNYATVAAKIHVDSTGTIGTGQVPAIMKFSTATSAGALTEALRLDASQVASFAKAVMVGSATPLTLVAGEVGLVKIAASGSAPGAAGGKFELVCGTNAGSAKVIVYAGTSTTPVTIVDNVGSGVTGC